MSRREELRAKILEKVGAVKEAHTEASLAMVCGEAKDYRARGRNEVRKSALFMAVFDDMVFKGEIVLDDRPIYEHRRVRLPEHLPKPLFQAPAAPPVTVTIDPSVVDRSIARAAPATQPKGKEPEIVNIKLPPSLVPVAKVPAKVEPMPAAAKSIAQPIATTRVSTDKVIKGKPNERAIAAWDALIELGQPFNRTTWTTSANLASGAVSRWGVVYDAVDVAIREMKAAGWQGMDQWLDVVTQSITKSEAPPDRSNEHLGTIAELERRVAVLLAENAELKLKPLEPVQLSPIEVLVGKVKALDVALNAKNNEALALGAEIQQMEQQRMALLGAIGVLEKGEEQ